MTKRYLECDCGCTVISVFHDDWDEYAAFVWLIFHGDDHAGLKDRIRAAWHILKYGHAPGTREILLRKAAALELARIIRHEAEQIT